LFDGGGKFVVSLYASTVGSQSFLAYYVMILSVLKILQYSLSGAEGFACFPLLLCLHSLRFWASENKMSENDAEKKMTTGHDELTVSLSKSKGGDLATDWRF